MRKNQIKRALQKAAIAEPYPMISWLALPLKVRMEILQYFQPNKLALENASAIKIRTFLLLVAEAL